MPVRKSTSELSVDFHMPWESFQSKFPFATLIGTSDSALDIFVPLVHRVFSQSYLKFCIRIICYELNWKIPKQNQNTKRNQYKLLQEG